MMMNSRLPVVFIHGLWLHASSWDPWRELFDAKGYAPVAPGWPGDQETVAASRSNPELQATLPVFKSPANKHKAVSLTVDQFRHSFGNAISETESDAIYEQWTIPAPGKPLFEAAAANFTLHSPDKVNTGNPDRGPLLLVMGKQDRTVPEAITKSTLRQYRGSPAETDLLEFDRGHSLTVDSGRREVADGCLDWLDNRDL